MRMKRSQIHAGSARGLGRLVLRDERHCSWKNPASWRYSIARHGSLTLCSNPSTNAPEACSASGAVIAPVSDRATGSITYSSGVGCGTDTEVFNSIPPSTAPPMLNPETMVIKVTNYNSTTGVGTGTYTAYSGGSCSGATFDSSGATEEVTGTLEICGD
jgi:hypothetical protein